MQQTTLLLRSTLPRKGVHFLKLLISHSSGLLSISLFCPGGIGMVSGFASRLEERFLGMLRPKEVCRSPACEAIDIAIDIFRVTYPLDKASNL